MFGRHDRGMRRTLSLALIVSLAAAACSSAAPATERPRSAVAATSSGASASSAVQSTERLSGGATQTSDTAGVTIAVTWAGPAAGAVFDVQIDNHMIDLGSMDLSKATLSNDRGDRLSGPTWDGGSSGHHRADKLEFASSTPGFFAAAVWVQLELPSIGDSSPRDFKWTLAK